MTRFNIIHRLVSRQDRLFDRIRHPAARTAADPERPLASDFRALEGVPYALLVTFRRSGEPVPTPVWFGLRDGLAYVRSLADAGKVKRLRRDPRILLGPCDRRGRPTGPMCQGVGWILEPGEESLAEAALRDHYGIGRRIYEGAGTALGVQTVYLALRPQHRP